MEQDGTLTEPTSTFQQLNRNPDSVTQMIHSLCCEQFHVGTIFPQQNYTCSPYRCTAGSSIHSDWQRRMSNINDVTVRGSIHSVGGEEFHFLYSDNQTFRKDVSWVYVPTLFRLNFLFLSRLSSVLTLWFGSGTKTSLSELENILVWSPRSQTETIQRQNIQRVRGLRIQSLLLQHLHRLTEVEDLNSSSHTAAARLSSCVWCIWCIYMKAAAPRVTFWHTGSSLLIRSTLP